MKTPNRATNRIRLMSFMALFLTWVLLLPAVIQLTHTLEGHKHKVCGEFSTHFHQKNKDCSLFDFHPSPIYQWAAMELNVVNGFAITKEITTYRPQLQTISVKSQNNKGPPVLFDNI